jgi:hypothetical protein
LYKKHAPRVLKQYAAIAIGWATGDIADARPSS